MSAVALDPLIAEAKSRARRRRLIALGLILVVGVAAFGVILGTRSSSSPKSPLGQLDGSAVGRTAPVESVGTGGGAVWAGTYGRLWLSTNGGRTWLSAISPRMANVGATSLGDVQFVDRRHGWVSNDTGNSGHMGQRWAIDRTTDGGRTWQASAPPDCRSCNFGNLSFFDARHGYVFVRACETTWVRACNRTKLFSTSDGGATWLLVSEPHLTPPAEARFVDAQHGVAVTWEAGMAGHFRAFRTSDGGRTWQPVLLEGKRTYPGYFGDPYITAVDGTLVIPAERFQSRHSHAQPVVYTSSDGGAHWQTHLAPAKVFFGYTLFSAASPDTWVASDDHTRHFFETTDGGTSWHEFTAPRGFFEARWIHFASARVGWVVLANNLLVRTTDGGAHWTYAGPSKPKPHRHR